jgi:hypothetical protein
MLQRIRLGMQNGSFVRFGKQVEVDERPLSGVEHVADDRRLPRTKSTMNVK